MTPARLLFRVCHFSGNYYRFQWFIR